MYSDNFYGKKHFSSTQNCHETLLSRQKETGSGGGGGGEMGHLQPAHTGEGRKWDTDNLHTLAGMHAFNHSGKAWHSSKG